LIAPLKQKVSSAHQVFLSGDAAQDYGQEKE